MTRRLYLDVHALHNVPPSNTNRDDTGSPKTAIYGGVPRARVSSQAWKRATRRSFADLLDPSELGVRTKQLVELLARRVNDAAPNLTGDQSAAAAEAVLRMVIDGSKFKLDVPKRKADRAKERGAATPHKEAPYLVFFSNRQLDQLATLAVEGAGDVTAFSKDKAVKARAKQIANSLHSVDIALFGRMAADAADINVDAAAQVAHALSVHRVENESDYYTAVDDQNDADDRDAEAETQTGAGMIGTVDFNSATLYRYAALNVRQLTENLGAGLRDDEPPHTPTRRAVEAFTRGFIASLPTGKINTFGHHTLPDAVVVTLRSTRPVSFVSAFEQPVLADESSGGHMEAACARLAGYVPEIERAYGEEKTRTWVLLVGPHTRKLADLGSEVPSLTALVTAVGEAVAEHLEQPS